VIGACVIGLAGASFLRAVMVAEVSVRVGRIAATRIMTHLLSLPLKFFDTRAPSELAYRLSGLAAIRDTLSSQVIAGVLEIGTVAVFLGYLIDKSLVLTALVAGLVLLVVLLLFGTRRAVYTAIQNEVVQVGKAQTQQIEAIQSILTMKSNGSSAFFLRRWTVENDLALHYLGERSRIQGAVNAVLGGVQTGGPLVVLMTGLALWGDGHLSIGDAIAAQAITISLFGSVSSIYSSITQVMLCQQYARRLHDITESEPEPVGQHRGTTWAPLEVAGATYRYSRTAPPVLEDVSMVVGPGEKVAVVGATGSGKSTLARLLLGLYPPSSGSVRMGGHDLRDTDRDHVLRNVAFVPQSITLETMSVRRNIDQGRDLPLEQVRLAAQRAGVAAEIEALPMGYETLVGNLGENFSGGQRQRIGIARALASDPSMLVLDEATSSLDHATEVSIMQRVTELDCAAVIIAHRLASVRRADRIYVLDRGRVVEVGTHEELMTKRGRYWDMFSGQLEVGNALEEVAS
jgi:ABC-type bacteriocin/lantibiotic exporter with double-glycine peptidase domain